MVDSVKNYGIAGVGANVEIGKGGPIIVGSDSSQIKFTDKDGALEGAAIGQGSQADHGVTKGQLDLIEAPKLQYKKTTVTFDGGTQALGTAGTNTTIHEVVVEKDATWTSANSVTALTVGDSGDVDRLFAEFDVATQTKSTPKHKYTSSTDVNAIVTQGGAVAGDAVVTVFYSGQFE
mgnify:FL=1|jgi:hypothetical protein|tara:strand:- start:1959 stop:2489 length:531 start_codon:yes stop_codon:yes gene_type:complete